MMGWWDTDRAGTSFEKHAIYDMVWGDAPADIIHAAIDRVSDEFEATWRRPPSKAELRAGLEFHIARSDAYPEDAPPRSGTEAYLGGLQNRVPEDDPNAQ